MYNFITKIYDIENFKKYNNFYTLINYNQQTYKRIYPITDEDIIIHRYINYETLIIYKEIKDKDIKPVWIVLGINHKIVPIFGHFVTNDNYFIYTDINNISYKPLYNIKYLKKPLEKFVKPVNEDYYQFYDIEDFKNSYLPIKNIEEEKYLESIKDKKAYIESILLNNDKMFGRSFEYSDERIKSYISSDKLRIYLNGEKYNID